MGGEGVGEKEAAGEGGFANFAGGEELAEVVREEAGVGPGEGVVVGLDVGGDGGLRGSVLLGQRPDRTLHHLQTQIFGLSKTPPQKWEGERKKREGV